jgi:hypothetical protein
VMGVLLGAEEGYFGCDRGVVKFRTTASQWCSQSLHCCTCHTVQLVERINNV